MNRLASVICNEVQQAGAIPFSRFMELALYAPGLGYYEQPREIGRRGDFFTSASVGRLFGELLAHRFATWPNATPGAWQIVESGAHDGRLAADILTCLRAKHGSAFEQVQYCIVEPSPTRMEWQKRELAAFPETVLWFESWEALPPTGVSGVIFCNELLDAMPVRRLGWDAARRHWFEWGVDWDGTQFVWKKLAAPGIQPDFPTQLMDVLPDGFTIEISTGAVAWWRQAARVLRAGKLVAIDYGLTADEWLRPERSHGTLRAYFRHHAASNLLSNPGEQDITAHVNFTALQEAGESLGLKTEGLFSQARFLTDIAAHLWSREHPGQWTPLQIQQFKTLTHPDHLGHAFRVLVQSAPAPAGS